MYIHVMRGCWLWQDLISLDHVNYGVEVSIHGAKNSALPLLSACLLCNSECILHNCPRLSDVDICIKILEHLGCKRQKRRA